VVLDGQAKIRAYIRHRAAREQAVVRCLQQQPCTLEMLQQQVYPSLDPTLLPLAALSIQAHLYKLQEEHTVQETNGVWMLA
jgi:hypothetical protein